MTQVLRWLGFSRQKVPQAHPQKDAEAQQRFKKRAPRGPEDAAEAHPDKRLELCFQDDARVGNKGRVCHRWWLRGQRASGPRQIGHALPEARSGWRGSDSGAP